MFHPSSITSFVLWFWAWYSVPVLSSMPPSLGAPDPPILVVSHPPQMFEAVSKEIFPGRSFLVFNVTKKLTLISCCIKIMLDCAVTTRKALHYDERRQFCECGQLSGSGTVSNGTLVESLPGIFMASPGSLPNTDYSNHPPPPSEIHIPLNDTDFTLFYFNGNDTSVPTHNGLEPSLSPHFNGDMVLDLENKLNYQVPTTDYNHFSILVWFQKKEPLPETNYIWTFYHNQDKIYHKLNALNETTLEPSIVKNGGETKIAYFSGLNIQGGAFNHYGIVYAPEGFKLYVNGELSSSVPSQLPAGYPISPRLNNLAFGDQNTRKCACYLSDFYFFARDLDNLTIRYIYQSKL